MPSGLCRHRFLINLACRVEHGHLVLTSVTGKPCLNSARRRAMNTGRIADGADRLAVIGIDVYFGSVREIKAARTVDGDIVSHRCRNR